MVSFHLKQHAHCVLLWVRIDQCVMTAAKEDQVPLGVPVLIGLIGVIAWTAWAAGLDVTYLARHDVVRFYHLA